MSLLLWFPLNGDLTNNGVHKINMNTNNNVTINDAGKLGGKCYFLSGTALAAKGFTALNNTSEYSACCWVKFSSFPASGQAYCLSVNTISSTDYKFIIGIVSSDGTTAKMRVNANSKTDTGTLQLNTWYHLAFCVSGTKGYMYLDGELIKTVTGLSQTPASNFVIGGRSSNTGATSFNGTGAPAYYNDVRVYDHCLSPREVKQISQGLVMHYALNNSNHTNMLTKAYTLNGNATLKDEVYGFPYQSGDNTSGTTYKNMYSEGGFSVSPNEKYTVSFWARSSTSTAITVFFYNNTSGVVQVSNIKSSDGQNKTGTDGNCSIKLTPMWQKYWVTWTFASTGTATTKSLLFRLQAGTKADIALVKLEKGTLATPFGLKASEMPNPLVEKDLSGYNNNGTRSAPMVYASCDSGRYSNSTNFSNKSRIRATNFSTEGWPDLTLAAWVRPINLDNGTDINTIIIGGAYLAIRSSSKRVATYCYGKNPTGYNYGQTALPLNQWSHIAAVWDGTNGTHKIYVNGVEDLSITCTGISTGGTQTKKDIGRENDGTRTFDGDIADARIYATALSAEDIKTLATSSIAITEKGQLQGYEFNEDFNSLKLNHNGGIDASDISEIGYLSGMKIKVLPDDKSAWARIYWLDLTSDKTVFTSENVKYSNESNRFSRLAWLDHFRGVPLPTGYQELTYIESTGTQYIDTGYYWRNENVQVILDAYITSNSSNQSLFGNEEKYEGGDRYFSIIPHGKNGSFSLYTGKGSVQTVSLGLETRFTLDCSTSDNKLTTLVNDTQISSVAYTGTVKTYANATSTDASKGKIYLFANHNSTNNGAGPTQTVGGMRVYSFKMYDNGKIVRNFIPCKDPSGAIGLFDLVYRVFYTSPEGTAFTAGAAVTAASGEDGVFEFMLTYPDISAAGYNRWIQINSPNDPYGSATGFKKIKTTWSSHNNAITRVTSSSKSSSFYAANSGGNWWSPIGQMALYDGDGIPAANGGKAYQTELWVRIDTLPKLNKVSMLNNKYIQAFEIKEN